MKSVIAAGILALLMLPACESITDDLSDYDKAPDKGLELEKITINENDQFLITSRSVLITGFFKESNELRMPYFEMFRGDVVSFTGFTVEFPSGLQGYEFEVVSAVPRYRDRPQDSDPETGDLLYLSEREINDHLQRISE